MPDHLTMPSVKVVNDEVTDEDDLLVTVIDGVCLVCSGGLHLLGWV